MCLRILALGLLNLLWIGSLQANPLFEDTSPDKQYDKAYALYKKVTDVNTPLSPFEDLARVVVGVLHNKDYGKAYQLYEKMNDGGSAAGATGLGDLYFSGLGVEQNYSKAKFYHSRRKAPSFSYGDIRLAPAWLC
ncbi:hypothetical protein [Helicobacter salomonis]|uniref:hypothetical protein n=1 Tax=Helicobacter salomonis TaxID=56878 RepID=UPI0013152E4B|nr:hypothetical protein [Helicobacter salomonis]